MPASRGHLACIRLIFSVATAALAVAIADLSVETLANHGVFGRGVFTDGSNADILPTITFAVVLLAGLLSVRARHALRTAMLAIGGWRTVGVALSLNCIAWLLPLIFAIQIALLWGIETVEQYFVVGHVLGGTIWLGGPIDISLALHALFCCAIAFLTRRLLTVLEPQAVRLICVFIAFVEVQEKTRPSQGIGFSEEISGSLRSPVLRSISKRGPPAWLLSSI